MGAFLAMVGADAIPSGPAWAVASVIVISGIVLVIREVGKLVKSRNGNGHENGAAERRTAGAVDKIVERIDRNHEILRNDVQLTRHAIGSELAKSLAPIQLALLQGIDEMRVTNVELKARLEELLRR